MTGAADIDLTVEPPDSPDALWCLDQYFAELNRRFEAGFNPSLGSPPTMSDYAPPQGAFIIARRNGHPVGCGALSPLDVSACEVKRVWISPDVRGIGVASRIMDWLEALALKLGYSRVRLDTNEALSEARRLYLKRGYREIAAYNDNPYAHFWFEKELSQ